MAACISALIFMGFWLTGVLSQSPHFTSYSDHLTSLIPEAFYPVLTWGGGGTRGSFLLLCSVRSDTWGRTQALSAF